MKKTTDCDVPVFTKNYETTAFFRSHFAFVVLCISGCLCAHVCLHLSACSCVGGGFKGGDS